MPAPNSLLKIYSHLPKLGSNPHVFQQVSGWLKSDAVVLYVCMYICTYVCFVNVWQNPLQYCKVSSLQLIKINGKKIKATSQWLKKKWSSQQWSTTQHWKEMSDQVLKWHGGTLNGYYSMKEDNKKGYVLSDPTVWHSLKGKFIETLKHQ